MGKKVIRSLAWICVIVLAAAAGGAGMWRYMDLKLDEKSSEVSNLTDKIEDLEKDKSQKDSEIGSLQSDLAGAEEAEAEAKKAAEDKAEAEASEFDGWTGYDVLHSDLVAADFSIKVADSWTVDQDEFGISMSLFSGTDPATRKRYCMLQTLVPRGLQGYSESGKKTMSYGDFSQTVSVMESDDGKSQWAKATVNGVDFELLTDASKQDCYDTYAKILSTMEAK